METRVRTGGYMCTAALKMDGNCNHASESKNNDLMTSEVSKSFDGTVNRKKNIYS